ncbi:MAG: radical SAM protein [Kiritimatiellaeota bacterium]|nr:radical SAM protein [Kiritimatiellota bacterium]
MEKQCPAHGAFRTRVAKDARRFRDDTFSAPAKPFAASRAYRGDCGTDCGWCDNHGQHICTGLVEITDECNLACPVCYFGAKRDRSIPVDEFKSRVQALLDVERGHLDILQISGGECFLHPQWQDLLEWALTQSIGRIVFNTNGLALLDNGVLNTIARHNDRVEIYLQFDGFDDAVYRALRGRAFLADKRAILQRLDAAAVKICLAVTLYEGNLKEIPAILKLATETRHISGVTFQRLTKVGNARDTALAPVFQEDILLAIASSGIMRYKDMIPLPCSHENCTSLGLLFCAGDKAHALGEYVDLSKCKEALSNRLAFDQTALDHLKKNVCGCCAGMFAGNHPVLKQLQEFAQHGNGSCYRDMKIVRVIVKNFMDADTFDFERARKCCSGVSVGNGRVVPFCIHNALKGKSDE